MMNDLYAKFRTLLGIVHGSRAFGGPLLASLSLTNRCNIRCLHCYFYSPFLEQPTLRPLRRARQTNTELPDFEKLRSLQQNDMDTGTARSLIDSLLAMGTQRFQFSGNGEVFFHKDALELMARAKHNSRICFANTNGTLLGRTEIDELIKMGFDELRITLMAGTEEMYARTHPVIPHGSFSKLKDSLLYLADRKKTLNKKKPEVTLVYIIIKQNYNGLFDFARFAHEVRADGILIRPVDDIEDPGLARLVPDPEQDAHVKNEIIKIKAYLEKHKIRHNISDFIKVFNRQLDTSEIYSIIPCYYSWLAVMIEADGMVYPCCRCYEPLGNIYEKEFGAVWYGDVYRSFRDKALKINVRKKPVVACDCFSCVHYSANLRIYRIMHPIRARRSRLSQMQSGFSENA